jgi:hypothetical protein
MLQVCALVWRRVLHPLKVGVHRCELRLLRQWPAVAHDSPEEHIHSGGISLAILFKHVDGVSEVFRCPQAISQPLHNSTD